MNTDIELKHHIITEFARNFVPCLILEEHGYISDIDELIEYFKKMVEGQIQLAFSDGIPETVTREYKDKINFNTFFEYYKLNLKIVPSNVLSYKGGAAPKSVYVHPQKGEWVCVPDIELTINTNNALNAMKTFSFAIGHELTHCYDLLQYAKETGQDPWYSLNRNKYFDIRNNQIFGIGNNRAIAQMLYHLNKTERNAYIAQLRQELLSVKDKIKDSKTAIDAVKNTESYKKFISLENNINIIFGITDKDVQTDLLSYTNDIMGKKFTTYNQLKKYYLNRWQKWKYKYLTTASKIVYDVYSKENKNEWLDYGMMGNNDIKIQEK